MRYWAPSRQGFSFLRIDIQSAERLRSRQRKEYECLRVRVAALSAPSLR